MGGTMRPKTSPQSPASSEQKGYANGYTYRPHGKFASTYGLPITNDGGRLQLQGGCAAGCEMSLRKGTLGGQAITYIQKDYLECTEAFKREVYMFSHDTLLRPLQGVCVPRLIAAYASTDGRPYITMEPVNECAWRIVNYPVDERVKEGIRRAYKQLHDRGILHSTVKRENMLFDDMYQIHLLDFSNAATIDDHTTGGLRQCTREDLVTEAQVVECLLSSPPDNEISKSYFEIPEEMRSPRWQDTPQAYSSVLPSPHDNLTQPPACADSANGSLPTRHTSTKSQTTPCADSRRSSLLSVSTDTAGMQGSQFDRLSVSDQTPLQLKLAPLREASSRPKRAAVLPSEPEDHWRWGHSRKVPKLSKDTERWREKEDDVADQSDTTHLTYEEPPPRPVEDTPYSDEAANFETVIIITSPTGDNCVYGVSAEIAARIQKELIFAKAKPLPLGTPSVATQKRAATSPHPDQPPSKRAQSDGSDTDDDLPVGRVVPRVEHSRALKRKAEDEHEEDISAAERPEDIVVRNS